MGTAIWLLTLKEAEDGKVKLDFNTPRVLELIEKFLQVTDYEFECSAIVGKKFEDVNKHSEYLKNGGCSEVINVLASV